ncbi:MAG: DUF4129 domain-containing protein [Defluviitaleaceae bacterium]|nr:DUF4129 domain-containing protein [Defluviitaleaceae bacterium]
MTLAKRYAFAVTPLFSEAVALYCMLIIFAQAPRGAEVYLFFPVYAASILASAFLNVMLFRKERSLNLVIMCNAVAAAFTTAFVLLSPSAIFGIGMHMYVLFMCIYPAGRSAYLVRKPIMQDSMLVCCELSILGTAFLLLLQLARPLPELVMLCFIAIALNLTALSLLRVMQQDKTNVQAPGMQRSFLLVGIGAIIFIFAAFLGVMLLPALRGVITSALGAVWQAVVAAARLFGWLLHLLMSRFTPDEIDMPLPPPAESMIIQAPTEIEYILIPEALIYTMLALFIAAIAAALVYFIYKSRGFRLRGITLSFAIKARSRSPSIFSVIIAALARLLGIMAFHMRLLLRFNTLAGVFVRIEHRGKRCGYPRHPSEPPREYLMRVCANNPHVSAETLAAFMRLASSIDSICFAPSPARNTHMDRSQRRLLLRALKSRQ